MCLPNVLTENTNISSFGNLVLFLNVKRQTKYRKLLITSILYYLHSPLKLTCMIQMFLSISISIIKT